MHTRGPYPSPKNVKGIQIHLLSSARKAVEVDETAVEVDVQNAEVGEANVKQQSGDIMWMSKPSSSSPSQLKGKRVPCNGDISSAGIGSLIFGNLSPGL
ncbi:unnamed protein product [Lactuca virosa]|uniref:Uncharacterized protein n=1 Tax=Lactuca virosa TaxID=75947 RepID=A0AAU9P0F5_9ASTR|nr:unnamed protein product [Lactuca virosa]